MFRILIYTVCSVLQCQKLPMPFLYIIQVYNIEENDGEYLWLHSLTVIWATKSLYAIRCHTVLHALSVQQQSPANEEKHQESAMEELKGILVLYFVHIYFV